MPVFVGDLLGGRRRIATIFLGAFSLSAGHCHFCYHTKYLSEGREMLDKMWITLWLMPIKCGYIRV